jgi:hypothetical protein
MFNLKSCPIAHFLGDRCLPEKMSFGNRIVLSSLICLQTVICCSLADSIHKNYLYHNLNPGHVRGVAFVAVISLLNKTKFDFGAIILSCIIFVLQKPFPHGHEPRTFFGVVAFVPIVLPAKRTNSALAPFSCPASFPSCRKHLCYIQPGQFFRGVACIPVIVC